ncbi:peptidyl-prolyl cis-trans isomerase FKBP14 [Hemiscyllium ocellatum]|uniref:peptidyl-prolyl cis-trans isomerase FKBP14 n=1 Tax=Hemiscyllium ocellatum TaxID=170820 RepID=UPI002966A339|nr:peptidyl-prolyl cis-trans isomerase FKBP14 [Hemiscyllium ocellatum]
MLPKGLQASLALVFTFVLGYASSALIPEADVKIDVLQKPFLCHRKTKLGDQLLVHYAGFFENGTMFHSSHKDNNGEAVWFTLGIKETLVGWDRGLREMCAGEKRKLVIPPSLAYGKEGKGKIPPESTLVFEIELLDIRNGPRSHESFQEMDLNDDWKLSRHEVKEYLRREFDKYKVEQNDTQQDSMVNDIFKNEDEDEDGYISAREFTYKHDEL